MSTLDLSAVCAMISDIARTEALQEYVGGQESPQLRRRMSRRYPSHAIFRDYVWAKHYV